MAKIRLKNKLLFLLQFMKLFPIAHILTKLYDEILTKLYDNLTYGSR